MAVQYKPSRGFWFAVLPPALLAVDMVYENTLLSWERGPQMIGFTLMHTVGIFLLLLILASLVWCAIALVGPLFSKSWNLGNIAGIGLIASLLMVASLPYGFWVKLFAGRIAKGPHAVEFLVHMAAIGERGAVEALLAQGVPINASDRGGIRAIEAAANAKQEEMRMLLESKGGTDKRF
jgi:hypothetical protein